MHESIGTTHDVNILRRCTIRRTQYSSVAALRKRRRSRRSEAKGRKPSLPGLTGEMPVDKGSTDGLLLCGLPRVARVALATTRTSSIHTMRYTFGVEVRGLGYGLQGSCSLTTALYKEEDNWKGTCENIVDNKGHKTRRREFNQQVNLRNRGTKLDIRKGKRQEKENRRLLKS